MTAREVTLALFAAPSGSATICPSEIARALATPNTWRDAMPAVHEAVDQLLADGVIRLSWKSRPLATRAGPYRISRPSS